MESNELKRSPVRTDNDRESVYQKDRRRASRARDYSLIISVLLLKSFSAVLVSIASGLIKAATHVFLITSIVIYA